MVLDITLEDIKKYIRDVVGIRVANILYYITFWTRGHWEA
jgi:ppGpp synthetase/RelA/SpoT-type nucleotidyltranferase